jgi:hypothetical protein
VAKKKSEKVPPNILGWEMRFIGAYLAIAGLALAGGLTFDVVHGWALLFPKTPISTVLIPQKNNNEQAAVPAVFVRRIDGQLVETQVDADRAPVGVMIENSIDARPQSGLDRATVVYETLAEGGVTRFLAMYLPTVDIKKIGPVRSARHYYVDWVEEYGSAYAHAGGSPLGLSQITRDHVPDLNGIGNAWRFFYRDQSLPAPHNLFTNSEQLQKSLVELGYPTSMTVSPWAFDDVQTPTAGSRGATSISIDFSGKAYTVRYEYDAVTRTYLRFNANVPHIDRASHAQLRTDNVIIQFVERPRLLAEKGRIDLKAIGSGKVLVFRNGAVSEGTWQKSSSAGRTAFSAADGTPIGLNRGTTWVEVVPIDRSVTY